MPVRFFRLCDGITISSSISAVSVSTLTSASLNRSVPLQNLNRSPPAVAERKHAARIGIKFEFQLVHPVIHCRDWNVMFLTPCFASLPTGLKFMDSFRPQCDFFIFFHNDTVSFLCYEKSVSKKCSCGQIRMIVFCRGKM